jgi:hypothetical protein
MNSFKDFWNSRKNKSDSAAAENKSELSTITQLSTAISQQITPIATVALTDIFGSTPKQKKIAQFTKEVTECATSDEVISTVSDRLGEPLPDETEEEFVERASNILKNVLKEKFNF